MQKKIKIKIFHTKNAKYLSSHLYEGRPSLPEGLQSIKNMSFFAFLGFGQGFGSSIFSHWGFGFRIRIQGLMT